MNAITHEGLLVTMFDEACCDRAKSPNCMALSALLTKGDHIWQEFKSRLPQEYSSQSAKRSASFPYEKRAYIASSSSNKNRQKNREANGNVFSTVT